MTSPDSIRPEGVSKKVAAIASGECCIITDQAQSRLIELLWFIQWMSLQLGSLRRFVELLILEFPARLGTATMRSVRGDKYTFEQKLAVCHELPDYARPYLPETEDSLAELFSDARPSEISEMRNQERRELESALAHFSISEAHNICQSWAFKLLPKFLIKLCTEEADRPNDDPNALLVEAMAVRSSSEWSGPITETWYFGDLLGALFEFMDRHAERTKARLAMTAVAKEIFETLDRIVETRTSALIRGNSRFGKTETFRTYCEAYPGRMRFVAVPPGNSMFDLLSRVAAAYGIDASYGTSVSRLRAKLSFIFQNGCPFPGFDEGAWLLPESYSRMTAPQRMNWIRSELCDRQMSVAIAVTPQWYDAPAEKFVSLTKYAIEQFHGRFERVDLLSELDESDLIKVAACHFPEIKSKADLMIIAACAKRTENYLQAIEVVEKRARYMAACEKKALTMEIVNRAIAKAFPRPKSLTAEPAPERPVNGSFKADLRDIDSAPKLDSKRISLRGNSPVKGDTELLSAET